MAVIDIAKFNRLFWLIRVGCATTPLALRGSRAVVPRVAEYGNPGLRTNPLRGNEYASFDGGRVVETSGVALSEDEEAWLTQLGVNLIVPMSGADGRMAGLLLLGEKKSEEPYTPNDRQLLQTITAQMAVVYENVWLKEHAAKEQKIKHEVLARFEDQQINLVKECPACGACYDSTSDACEKDQRELTLSLPVERTIDKKYRLEQMIGRGGMGAVYEATDLRLNRRIEI